MTCGPAPTNAPTGTGAEADGLTRRVLRRIHRAGTINLAEYMALALTTPGQGYYMTGDPFGAAGDFVTAPEISQMFGELIGLWCVDQWRRQGSPPAFLLVELGPGRGTLMADALRAARLVPDFLAAARLHLVEVSPALRARQARTLADAPLEAPPTWHERLGDLPEGPMLLVANEFFDALPVRQFVKRAAGWCETRVGRDADRSALILVEGPPWPAFVPPTLRNAPGGSVPEGSVVEVSAAAAALMTEIAVRVSGHGGAAVVTDYGYGEPPLTPSLQAVRRHRPAGLLETPGLCDLTAHVDFAALTAAAERGSAVPFGPVAQSAFLEELGIAARARALSETADAEQAAVVAAALSRLTDPDEMGRLFKAFAVLPKAAAPPAGFQTAARH